MKDQVIIFIGNEGCGYCKKFKGIWNLAKNDQDITKHAYLVDFITDEHSELPPCFGWVTHVPVLLKVSLSTYSQFFNPRTSQFLNRTDDLKGQAYGNGAGAPMEYGVFKVWATV